MRVKDSLTDLIGKIISGIVVAEYAKGEWLFSVGCLLVDTTDLKSVDESRASSNLAPGTKYTSQDKNEQRNC